MTKLIAGLGILAAIFALCLWSANSFEAEMKTIIDNTEEASALFRSGRRDEGLVMLDKAASAWGQTEGLARMFIHDSKTAELTKAFSEYRCAAETMDEDESAKYQLLMYMLMEIGGNEKLSLSTVF